MRPRLVVSTLIAAGVVGLLTVRARWDLHVRLLAGWDVGVVLYLLLAFQAMATSTIDRIRERAADEDEGQATILVLTVAAALASVGAIFAELATFNQRPLGVALAMVTIVLAWTFIHTIFALHYAHEFYDVSVGGGLAFPGGETEPGYWDFVYFSFVVGMTSQVSDVGVTSKQIRRLVAAHGVIAFFFNAALLALTINLAAGAISPSGK